MVYNLTENSVYQDRHLTLTKIPKDFQAFSVLIIRLHASRIFVIMSKDFFVEWIYLAFFFSLSVRHTFSPDPDTPFWIWLRSLLHLFHWNWYRINRQLIEFCAHSIPVVLIQLQCRIRNGFAAMANHLIDCHKTAIFI